jgi:hypothetical protein
LPSIVDPKVTEGQQTEQKADVTRVNGDELTVNIVVFPSP